MGLALLVIFAAVALAAYGYLRWASTSPVQAWVTAMAVEAVQMARSRYGVALTWETASLMALEEQLLPQVRQAQAAGLIPPIELSNHGMRWGAYAGEVVRRQAGGSWVFKPTPGQGGYPVLHVRGEALPIMLWAHQAITDGAHDAISRELQRLLPF